MATSYGPAAILGVILVVGVITFAIRLSFIGLFGYLEDIPGPVERALRYVPAAVLAALVLPSLLVFQPDGGLAVDKLLAGAVATGVAWRTENILATMAGGMAALWLVRLVM
jgi:branched-subunit amino acid transport protein